MRRVTSEENAANENLPVLDRSHGCVIPGLALSSLDPVLATLFMESFLGMQCSDSLRKRVSLSVHRNMRPSSTFQSSIVISHRPSSHLAELEKNDTLPAQLSQRVRVEDQH